MGNFIKRQVTVIRTRLSLAMADCLVLLCEQAVLVSLDFSRLLALKGIPRQVHTPYAILSYILV